MIFSFTGELKLLELLHYSLEGQALLEFPNLDARQAHPVRDFIAPFSAEDGTVRFSSREACQIPPRSRK